MGQRSGRQERSKKPQLALSETMEAETEVLNNKEEAEEVKAKNQRLASVFGVADLKNEAIGLYNLGQTCCLNSLLQVFLMNIHFTGILRSFDHLSGSFLFHPFLYAHYCAEEKEDKLQTCRDEKCHKMGQAKQCRQITVPLSAAQKKNSVPYQMLLLLEKMQRGKRKAVGPTELAYCLAQHRVRFFVQHDAAQLFLTLWNLLKKQMKRPELVEELKDLYTICIQEHLTCQKCSLEMKSKSTMITLPLPVLDAESHWLKSLEDCVQHFFLPEELTGPNMCFCQQCGRKTPFLQSTKLVHLPQTLTLHLKRFSFERSSRTYKLSHYLSFPQHLDFKEVLTENQCQADDSEKATWQYELFAVVAHSGSTNCGHYCAYVRSLTERKWYCFNDSMVCPVSWDDVKCTYGHARLNWRETAYLLIYMKKHPQ